MIYTIFNEFLSVSVESFGAELRSVLSADGTEYIWQRDERYWGDCAPVLFPYIARLYDNSYSYQGQRYNMGIHGFAAQCEFVAEDVKNDSLTLVLRENEATLRQYPFKFRFSICYSLSGASLCVSYRVENLDGKAMPFALGGHPGINVPFAPGTDFEDYYLSFGEACSPSRIGFTDDVFLSGKDEPYPLEDGRTINLSHSLFDDDAIILKDTAKSISLACRKNGKSLSISFTGFDYFGIWHMPRTDAPYVCLEPWTSLPSRQDVIEELMEKADMIIIDAGQQCEKHWTLSVSEG